MRDQPQYFYTQADYAILRGIAVHRPMTGQRGYYDLLHHKLAAGDAVVEGALPPEVVRLNSLVRYRISEGRPLEHRLVIGSAREVLGRTVSLRSLYGLALIGARAGQAVVLDCFDGPAERVFVEELLAQPESAERRVRDLREVT